jgi:hypothetical protein
MEPRWAKAWDPAGIQVIRAQQYTRPRAGSVAQNGRPEALFTKSKEIRPIKRKNILGGKMTAAWKRGWGIISARLGSRGQEPG